MSTCPSDLSDRNRYTWADPSIIMHIIFISLLPLEAWGLPPEVLVRYSLRSIVSLFGWQVDCLCINNGAALRGENLVYTAPTRFACLRLCDNFWQWRQNASIWNPYAAAPGSCVPRRKVSRHNFIRGSIHITGRGIMLVFCTCILRIAGESCVSAGNVVWYVDWREIIFSKWRICM